MRIFYLVFHQEGFRLFDKDSCYRIRADSSTSKPFPILYFTKPALSAVDYNDERLKEKPYAVFGERGMKGSEETIDIKKLSRTKGSAWAFENEARFYICTHKSNRQNKVDAIYFELSNEFYSGLEIIINPFANESEHNLIKNNLIQKSNGRLVEGNFKESKFMGKINY